MILGTVVFGTVVLGVVDLVVVDGALVVVAVVLTVVLDAVLLEPHAVRPTSVVEASTIAVRRNRREPERRLEVFVFMSLFGHNSKRSGTVSSTPMSATALDQLAGEWPLVGRADVIERFVAARVHPQSAVIAAATGIALVGPAGVGKTRLAAACLDDAATAGWRTVRIAGSSAASSIPFGAAAPLLAADGEGDTDFATIITRAHQRLTDAGRLCLVVDDAHLLDDASITLVQHIACTPGVIVVVTARSDRRTSTLLTALWRNGSLARIDLDSLGRDDHDAMIAAALGGPVDDSSARRLFEATGGNPLFARELMMAAAEDNALLDDGRGGWRLSRLPRTSSRLAELVAGRVGALDEAERRCLETIAVAEPIGIAVIDAMGFGDVVARLERRHLVQTVTVGSHVDLIVSHPLYAEVARDRLRPLRARNLRRSLADALEATASSRHGDSLRIATWRMAAGLVDSAPNLSTAAGEALLAGDVVNAERFAEAAHQAEPSAATALLLAQSYFRSRKGDATEALLGVRAGWSPGPRQRAALTVLRAKNLFWLLGRDDDAMAVLAGALIEMAIADTVLTDAELSDADEDENNDRRPVPVLGAVQSQLSDQIAELRVCRSMDAGNGDPVRLRTLTLLLRGRFQAALEGLRNAPGDADCGGLEAFVLVEGGWLANGALLAERSTQKAHGSSALADGWAQLALGTAQLADGNGARALAALRDAAATFERHSDPLPRALCVARIISALLLLGDIETARAELADAPIHAGRRIFGAELDRARVAVAVANGDRSEAVRMLRMRAVQARAVGHHAIEQVCVHDLIRLADADAAEWQRVEDLAVEVDGPLGALRVRHAACRSDGAKLGLLAGEVERDGFVVWACELASAAITSMPPSAPSRAGGSEQRRVIRLRSGFPRALMFAPSATPVAAPVQLRPGELQVARLAAEGLSDREISERLHLSIRTVGNYLLRSYRRLGISGRDELPAALADADRLTA